MQLESLLSAYEVTRLPNEWSLHLVWSEADDVVDLDGDAPIVLLDTYRVSRVPHTVAS